jgi:hypothetical protein
MAASASSLIRRGSSDLAVMLGQQGNVAAGLELTSAAVDSGAANEPMRQWLLGAHARLLAMAGRLDDAEQTWRASLEGIAEEGSLVHMHLALHAWLAGPEIALARGDRKAARERLDVIVRYTSERAIRWRADEIAGLSEQARG